MSQRILLVDDEPRNLALLEALLQSPAHETIRASSGIEAINIIADEAIDLVLLDLNMPEMDGIAVLNAIRSTSISAHIPVIIVTAAADRESRIRGLRAGADDFIEKPIDADILTARVKTLLGFKAARDAVEARSAAIQRLQLEQSELTELIVHDLKNPLSVAKLSISSAIDEVSRDPAGVADALQEADGALGRLQTMIEQLLLVARLERAEFPLRPERIALTRLLTRVERSNRREAEIRNIELAVELADDVTVSADASLLRRVLDNLVGNALRHTPSAGRIGLSAQSRDDIEITVSNTGFPIPTDFRPHLFEKFWRGPSATPNTRNAGLGLYFCRRAIEAHEGRITVVESGDWPTSFVVHLPVR